MRDRIQQIGIIRLLVLAGAIGIGVFLDFALRDVMSSGARQTILVFFIAAALWATEMIPLFATSLLTVCLLILLVSESGGLATSGGLADKLFLEPLSSGVIMLFLGGLMLSSAVSKHGVARMLAARLLKPFSGKPRMMLFAVMTLTAVASMWMSNTATVAMMLTIMSPLLGGKNPRPYHSGLLLGVAFSANLGGIGTPIGTPPNAIAVGALRAAGYEVTFIEWMMLGVPMAVGMTVLLAAILCVMFPPDEEVGQSVTLDAEVPSLDWRGRLTLVIAAFTALAWLTGSFHGVRDGVIALCAGATLTLTGLLKKDDMNTIDWSVLILMWGGLALGRAMQHTGLIDAIISQAPPQLTGVALAAMLMVLAATIASFMSHTASAALLVPVSLTLAAGSVGGLGGVGVGVGGAGGAGGSVGGVGGGVDEAALTLASISGVVLTAMACSFAMAMPVSTPPNALVFATGRLRAADMLKVGTTITVIGIVVTLLGYQVLLPWIFG